jgi:glycosyltransferase involved in cell wall biosynthesis
LEHPLVNIIITTYDPGDGSRTLLLAETVRYLILNLSYPNVHYIISDDGSPNHDQHIEFSKLAFDVNSISYEIINVERQGVGKSKNTSLQQAFAQSPYVLLLEDDWKLKQPLDLFPYMA